MLVKITVSQAPLPPPIPPPLQEYNSSQENEPIVTDKGDIPSNPEPDLTPEPTKIIEESDENSFLLTFSLSLNFILIISFIIFLIFWFKKKQMLNEPQKPYSDNQRIDSDIMELKNYITNYLNQGYNPDTIRQALLRSWPEHKVNRAFNEVHHGSRRAF
jgi:hypothetical protein